MTIFTDTQFKDTGREFFLGATRETHGANRKHKFYYTEFDGKFLASFLQSIQMYLALWQNSSRFF